MQFRSEGGGGGVCGLLLEHFLQCLPEYNYFFLPENGHLKIRGGG